VTAPIPAHRKEEGRELKEKKINCSGKKSRPAQIQETARGQNQHVHREGPKKKGGD